MPVHFHKGSGLTFIFARVLVRALVVGSSFPPTDMKDHTLVRSPCSRAHFRCVTTEGVTSPRDWAVSIGSHISNAPPHLGALLPFSISTWAVIVPKTWLTSVHVAPRSTLHRAQDSVKKRIQQMLPTCMADFQTTYDSNNNSTLGTYDSDDNTLESVRTRTDGGSFLRNS